MSPQVALALAMAFGPSQQEPERKSPPQVPSGAVQYRSATVTQSIGILYDRDFIRPFLIRRMADRRWHQPGGLEGATGWTAEKYRTLPETGRVQTWVGNVAVLNSFNVYQHNRGLLRRYPDGTRFDEVLKNEAGEVFEHRVREKHDGKWHSDIIYRNPHARPDGFKPVSVNECASCHDEAGTGKYAEGLVPGGDGVLSDPLDWSLTSQNPERTETKKQTAPRRTACECQSVGQCRCRANECSCAVCGKGQNRVVGGKVEKVEPGPQQQMQVPQFRLRTTQQCLT